MEPDLIGVVVPEDEWAAIKEKVAAAAAANAPATGPFTNVPPEEPT